MIEEIDNILDFRRSREEIKQREFDAALRDRLGCRHQLIRDPRVAHNILAVLAQFPPKSIDSASKK